MKNDERHACCICGKKIEGHGNNPFPVKTEGRCCDDCNFNAVIPARMDMLFPERTTAKSK